MVATFNTARPSYRFNVSGCANQYAVWDMVTGRPVASPVGKIETAATIAHFMNRHARPSALLALPSPFRPQATDTGELHGPHAYILLDGRYAPITTVPTLPDAHKFILNAAETCARTARQNASYGRLAGAYVHDRTVSPEFTYAAVSGYRHPFWSYDAYESMTVHPDIRRVIERLSHDRNPVAQSILAQMRDYLTPDSVGNYLLPDYDKAQLSYHPRGRIFDTAKSIDAQSGRVAGKPVRILKQLFPTVTGTDAEWETVNTRIGAILTTTGIFETVTGDALLDAYCRDNWSDSVTWHSCMSYDYCRDYLRLYADNPEQVSLLVMRDNTGRVMARSLIWQTDSGVYQDRIYASNDRETERMRTYAAETLGASRGMRGTVTLAHYDHLTEYPYMDTFCYFDPETGTLADDESLITHLADEFYVLNSTTGDYETRGSERPYTVRVTRMVTEYAEFTITATSEDDARNQAEELIEWGHVTPDVYERTRDAWEIDDIETDD